MTMPTNGSSRPHFGKSPGAGFTLIELMVAVLVASILIAIAVPSYTASVLKSHRVEAKTALLDLAGREERYFNANGGQYTMTQAGLGYGVLGNVNALSVGNGYYTVTVSNVVQPTALVAGSYTIQANAVGRQLQDKACVSFTLTSTGAQSALNSSGVSSPSCWQ